MDTPSWWFLFLFFLWINYIIRTIWSVCSCLSTRIATQRCRAIFGLMYQEFWFFFHYRTAVSGLTWFLYPAFKSLSPSCVTARSWRNGSNWPWTNIAMQLEASAGSFILAHFSLLKPKISRFLNLFKQSKLEFEMNSGESDLYGVPACNLGGWTEPCGMFSYRTRLISL